jgi:carbon storage regulator
LLVLSRKKNEQVVIGDNIVITVCEIRGDKVRLGIQADRDVPVHRREIQNIIESQNQPSPPSSVATD